MTDGLPPDTRIYVLDFGGEPAPAGMVDPDELDPDDPVWQAFPRDGLVLDAAE